MQGAINQISGLSTVANGATHKFTDKALVQQYANSLNNVETIATELEEKFGEMYSGKRSICYGEERVAA